MYPLQGKIRNLAVQIKSGRTRGSQGRVANGRVLKPDEIVALTAQHDALVEQAASDAQQRLDARRREKQENRAFLTAEVDRAGAVVVAAGNANAVQLTESGNANADRLAGMINESNTITGHRVDEVQDMLRPVTDLLNTIIPAPDDDTRARGSV